MKLSVASNLKNDLIEKIAEFKAVEEIFGKLPFDFTGGGRGILSTFQVNKKMFAEHVKLAQEKNIRFNYLLNGTAMDNQAFTRKGHKEIRKFLDWLTELKIDAITVSIPYLLQIIKTNYPHFKIYVSSIANVDSIEGAKKWLELGANKITLNDRSLNRNFKLLKAIRKNTMCQLELIANNNCLYQCPLSHHHYGLLSSASQKKAKLKGYLIDYCTLMCRYLRVTDPTEFIKAGWIRPEDTKTYEELGIDSLKLVGREMETEHLVTIVKAYSEQHYDGNLLDLFSYNTHFKENTISKLSLLMLGLKYYFKPFSINFFKLKKLRDALIQKTDIQINNKDLKDFLIHFKSHDCNETPCEDCDYCRNIAEKFVKLDTNKRKEYLQKYQAIIKELHSGEFFKA